MISLICAVAKNRAIGRKNQLLWNMPEDLRHFKEITTGHTIVMGQKTYESIGRALPNRKNIVLTLDPDFRAEGCEIRHSLEEFMTEAKNDKEEMFIIGGGQIFALTFPYADKLYLTLVDDEPQDADTFFPDFSEFKTVVSEEDAESGGYKIKFIELTK